MGLNPFLTARRKYGNTPTEYNGYTYDSKRESEKAQDLDMLVKAGEVLEWTRQPKFLLIPRFIKNGKVWRPTTYTADFWIKWKDGTESIVDIKGMQTDVFKIKQKIFEWRYPHLKLVVE